MPSTSTDRLRGLTTSVAVKPPCVAVATSAITLSGLQTVESVVLAEGDRVLVIAQASAIDNGIYLASSSAWERSGDFDGQRDAVNGTLIIVAGDSGTARLYEVTTANPIVIGTSSLTFLQRYGANVQYDPTPAETAASVTPTDKSYPPGDVRRYGTNTTPGTTNMTAALAAAILQNEQDGGAPIVTHAESYYISTGLTWLAGGQDRKTWISHRSVITTDQDIIPLTSGPISGSGQSFRSAILGDLEVIQTGTSTKQGFLIGQVYEGEWHLSADKFNWGIELFSIGSGCVYNNFYIGRLNRCQYGLYLHPTSAGWVNENNFFGGRFANGAITSQWHIYMPKNGSGSYPQPNNNKFYGASLENSAGGVMEGFYLDGGVGNLLHHPRQENNDTINTWPIWLTADSINCVVMHPYLGFAGNEAGGQLIHDDGIDNLIFAIDKMRWAARHNGQASTMLDFYRPRANNDSVPMAHMRDYYTGSQDAMAYKSSLYRQTQTGYHYQGVQIGSTVTGADGRDYTCILAHTSAAADEPGVGVNWETYWERLPSTAANGTAWATTTGYVAETVQFMISAQGRLRTNQPVADTSAIPANATHKWAIYDGAGTLIGYIPIVADF